MQYALTTLIQKQFTEGLEIQAVWQLHMYAISFFYPIKIEDKKKS